MALSYPLLEPVYSRAVVRLQPVRGQLTATQLASDLRRGAQVKRLPTNLQPSLADDQLPTDVGCRVGRAASRSKPCIVGDTKSHISVVVFGDSHALMWLPALTLISEQHHWRLIDFSKSGCPPVEVNVLAWFLHGVVYSACSQWRARAMTRIAALRPRLVIVSWARWLEELEARPTPGVPTGHGGPWQDGVAATFSFLRHAARRVIFISDIPTLRQSAPLCLWEHQVDVQACTPTRSAAIRLPTVKADELCPGKPVSSQFNRPDIVVLHPDAVPTDRPQHPRLPRQQPYDRGVVPVHCPRARPRDPADHGPYLSAETPLGR